MPAVAGPPPPAGAHAEGAGASGLRESGAAVVAAAWEARGVNETRNVAAAAAVLGVLLAVGLAAGGYLVGVGIGSVRSADRHVTVKGFAEREVKADLAIWPLVYNTTGNDLAELHARLDRDADTIQRFLLARGFAEEEISRSAPRVTDFVAQMAGPNRPEDRYAVEATVTLRSARVDAVQEAMQDADELVKGGVTLIRSWEAGPLFLYTQLESIKPEMIAEATRDARRAAEQFAQDSGSRVGAIRNAQQGYFQIEDRDQYSPAFKKVRVVTTIDYFLED